MSRAHRSAHLDSATLVFSFAISLFLGSHPTPATGEVCPFYVGDATYGTVAGDFNGDGLGDVAVSSAPMVQSPDVPKVTVFLGSSGSAPAVHGGIVLTGDWLTNLAVGDMNEDGTLDLVGSYSTLNYVRVMPGDGSGGFSLGQTFPIEGGGPMVGDFNGDGHLDVAVAHGVARALSVLFGDGRGHLGPEQIVLSGGINRTVVGDVNGDDRADIVGVGYDSFGSAPDPLLVFLGNADGTFTALPPQATAYNLWTSAIGDLNDDGHLDFVAATSLGAPNVLTFLGNGDGTFVTSAVPAVAGGMTMIRLGDVDADGHLDAVTYTSDPLFSFCSENTPLYFHHGMGNGTLADGIPVDWNTNSASMALADMNGDGYLDAALPGCGLFNVRLWNGTGFGDLENFVNDARAFTIKNNNEIKLNANKVNWYLHLEGVGFDASNADMSNANLISVGTGNVTSIHSNTKERIIADSDGNGTVDQEISFPKDQLRLLFSNIVQTQTVNVMVEGTLAPITGCQFRAPLSVTVIPANGSHAAAAMNPNVFASSSVLSFETPRGQVRARIYDVSGRLVKTLMEGAAEGGPQRLRVEARDGNGKPLASGVYFFRIDSPSGPESGRFVIAR